MFLKVSNFKLFLFIFICFISFKNLKAENSSINFPSFFMKNQGQYGNGSQYCLKSAGSNTFFYENHIVSQFITTKNKNDSINPNILNMRIDFEHSNPHPQFEEKDPLSSKSNFFIGNDALSWETDIASFATLAYRELYDKVDLVYYNSAKGIKSDFVIHSGGNCSDIRLKYSGVKDISINSQGALKILTDAGEITEHIPEAYQIINGTKVMVNVNFRIKNGNTIKFEAEEFNPDYDLVIDPQLIYCSYFGGNSDDKWPNKIVRDSQQNIYFAGNTMSSNFPVTPGVFSTTYSSGDYDVFVLKLDPTGTKLLFSTFIGGPGQDIAGSIKLIGASNDILLVGLAGYGGFPTTAGAYQTIQAGGNHDIFVLKMNNNGSNLIFSTLVGGATDEQISDFCLDKNGDIYVLGYAGYYFPTTSGAYQETLSGDYDVCVFKLSSNGTKLLYSTFIGGPDRDRSGGIAIDMLSNIYVSSSDLGSFPTTAGAYDNTFNGDIDLAVSKFDPTLSTLIFSTMIGGPGEEVTTSDLILDADNNITLVGRAGSGFPTTPGSFDQSFNGGNTDAIIIKLKNDGSSLLYSSFLGGPGNDFARDFTDDGFGNYILTGYCENGFPTTACPYDNTFNGGATDCFISKININTQSLFYSTYFGGTGDDEGFTVLSSADTIIIAGTTSSSDLPVTSETFDPSFNYGGNDIFMIKLLPGSGIPPVAQFNTPSVTCINQPTSFINSSVNSTSYSWNFGDGYISNIENPTHSYSQSGNYIVSLLSLNQCSSNTTLRNIKVEGGGIQNAFSSICKGDSVFLGGSYRSTVGNYLDTLTSISGCDSIISTILTLTSTIQTIQTPSICQGDAFKVGSNNYTVQGIYIDELKAVFGCDSIVTTNLTVIPTIKSNQTLSICEGEKFNVGTHYYTFQGTYIDTLTSVFGCDSIVTTNLSVNPLPVPLLGNDTLMCPGDFIVLTPGNGFSSYFWSDGSDLSELHVYMSGSYFVNVSDGLCSASDTISIGDCGTLLWFPNVFTPNNDGLNDRFKPVAQGVLTSYQILIFNRWGQQLYESNDAYPGWNGTFKGNQCPEGTYFYIAEYSVGALKQSTTRGSITLLR